MQQFVTLNGYKSVAKLVVNDLQMLFTEPAKNLTVGIEHRHVVKWIWSVYMAICFPEVCCFVKSIYRVCFRNVKTPTIAQFFTVKQCFFSTKYHFLISDFHYRIVARSRCRLVGVSSFAQSRRCNRRNAHIVSIVCAVDSHVIVAKTAKDHGNIARTKLK